jgi:Ca2+-binding EF-hand superfamily protein
LISSFVHPLSKVWFIRTIVSVYKSFRQSSTTSSFASSDIMDDQIEELRQQFHVFDANGSGFIEKYELKEALKTLGFQISEKGFDNLLHIVESTDDRLNFDEFIVWNRELYKEEMKNEFDTIDADNSGWISKSELREYSKKMKYDLTEEQIEDFLYQADANQNDKVGLDEYISAMVSTALYQRLYCCDTPCITHALVPFI